MQVNLFFYKKLDGEVVSINPTALGWKTITLKRARIECTIIAGRIAFPRKVFRKKYALNSSWGIKKIPISG